MTQDHKDDKFGCMFCGLNSRDGEEHRLTEEHVIPEVLGGWLTIPFVCRKCNSDYLGSKIESKLKKNGFVVTALDRLRIQPRRLAYREANIELEFNLLGKLKAQFNKEDKPTFISQKLKDDSIIIPEDKAKEVLKKQIARWQNKTGEKINFNLSDFDNLPYDIALPIYGTKICFIKRKNQGASITIAGLDEPIPFRIPAIIAFEHLAGLYYPFVLRKEFDPISLWILNKNRNRHVLLNTPLRNLKPDDLDYLPYHFIKFGFQSGGLSAIVGLFGVIKFLVFLAELNNIDDFPAKDLLEFYHVYDLKKRELTPEKPSKVIEEDDRILLDAVTKWGLQELRNENTG